DVNLYLNLAPINDTKYGRNVYMGLNADAFVVSDSAQGIPWMTLVNALLIPSSSSKTRQPSTPQTLEPPTISPNINKVSSLIITVNDIRIITIEKTYTFSG